MIRIQSKHPHHKQPDLYQWAVDNPSIVQWKTNSASKTILLFSILTLSPDVTGAPVEHSTLFDDREISILWRVPQSSELQIFQGNEEHQVQVYENDREVFHYCADWRELDNGARTVVINDGIKEGSPHPGNGFQTLDSAVEVVGRTE